MSCGRPYAGKPVIVACPGPSLTTEAPLVAETRAAGVPVLAVNHAYRTVKADGFVAVDRHTCFQANLPDIPVHTTEASARSWPKGGPPVHAYRWAGNDGATPRRFGDGVEPILKVWGSRHSKEPVRMNNGVFFGLQVAACLGASCVWLVGSELKFEGPKFYAHPQLAGDPIHAAEHKHRVYGKVLEAFRMVVAEGQLKVINTAMDGRLVGILPSQPLAELLAEHRAAEANCGRA